MKKALPFPKGEIIADYRLAYQSRVASLLGRKETLTGKAKFGIFGDGKELAQIAMARAFKPGDFRSGYYRDQTVMFATGMSNIAEFFAQLYAINDEELEPSSCGRQMTAHFGTRLLDTNGMFKPQTQTKNSSSDISPTGGQMARALGLAYASKIYRTVPALKNGFENFSIKGNEVVFCTIGNASTSEGVFFETLNAAGVLNVPLSISIWDDGYGISVPAEYQTTKSSISEIISGFEREGKGPGIDLHVVKGWDYVALREAYELGVEKTRRDHVASVFHITEITQPQGHSTSGSHERYKSKERLAWEEEKCCVRTMRKWMIDSGVATDKELLDWEAADRKMVESISAEMWKRYTTPLFSERDAAVTLIENLKSEFSREAEMLESLVQQLKTAITVNRKLVQSTVSRALLVVRFEQGASKTAAQNFLKSYNEKNLDRYCSHVYSESNESPLKVPEQKPVYDNDSKVVDGRMILQACFDALFDRDARVFAIGEDVGKLGDVNQGLEGIQGKYGEERITDTGIREATILGQGLGAAMRGLRPLIEIQYLDYLLYALQTMSDDLATMLYRTKGGQKSPVIIRTRGHRLEGVWHSGSPMGMILSSCRGIYVCVPRNMTQAAGMYNTLFQGDNPALLIEVLSGYRLKERMPANVGCFTVPLGVPETIRVGRDITVVTYGACCRLALEASVELEKLGVEIEIIDVQTLLPFDINQKIVTSIRKTNAVLFLDEDVPGGASAFMMQQVLENQRAYDWLDVTPRTLAAKENRPAYGTDGDYFCKPNIEDIVEAVYSMMREREPNKFPTYLS